MTATEWMTSGGLLSVVIFAIATYVKSNNQASRIYQRLDEVKEQTKQEFTKKDVCEVVHKNLDKNIGELKESVKYIPEIKAGMDLLLKKNGINSLN